MSVGSTISLFGSSKRTRTVFVCVEGLCKVPFVDWNSILLGSNIELKKTFFAVISHCRGYAWDTSSVDI